MGVQVEVGLAILSFLHALHPLSQDGTIANPTHTCAGGHQRYNTGVAQRVQSKQEARDKQLQHQNASRESTLMRGIWVLGRRLAKTGAHPESGVEKRCQVGVWLAEHRAMWLLPFFFLSRCLHVV